MTKPDRITRGRRSRFDRLPDELLGWLRTMLAGGEDQTVVLAEFNETYLERFPNEKPLSAAGLCRFAAREAEYLQRAREGVAICKEVTGAVGEGGIMDLDRGLAHALQANTMRLWSSIRWEEMSPEEAAALQNEYALLLRRTSNVKATTDARERAILADAAARAAKAAKAAVDAAGREAANSGAPFSPEALRRIREEVYGIVEEPVA